MTHCKHDIHRDDPCSQCADDDLTRRANAIQDNICGYLGRSSAGAPAIHPQVATGLCDPGSSLLLTNQPVPASGHSADAGKGAFAGERIYEYTVRTVEGKLYAVTLLLTPQHLAQLQRESIVPHDVREIVSRQYVADAVVAMIEMDGETVQ